MSNSQGLLFSEPSIAETGVWCSLNEGIDPSEWAYLCRFIGNLSPNEFKTVRNMVQSGPGSVLNSIKKKFDIKHENSLNMPVFSIGPSGIGGEYQREG